MVTRGGVKIMAEPTYEGLRAQLEALKSQQSRKPGDFSLKVSEKRAVSVHYMASAGFP
jgi:hypothetical protein